MKKYINIALAILVIFIFAYLYKVLHYTYITARFQELRPFHHNIPVYYKGIVIGKAHERSHSKDYKHTLVKITLFPQNLLLPVNTQAFLKKEKRKNYERDFIELIYPKEPSNVMLANNSEIEGLVSVDIDTFFSNRHPNEIEEIKMNLLKSSQALNDSLNNLSMLFDMLNGILEQNKNNLYSATTNLSQTTKNINNATGKINQSINQEKLNSTFDNIEISTTNLKTTTSDVIITNQNLNSTIEQLTPTLSNVQGITENLNSITCAIRKTLCKPFGGLRVLFGKSNTECE